MATAAPSQQRATIEDDAAARASAEQLRSRVVAIAGRLEKEALERVSKRNLVDQRMLRDVRQYQGVYEDKILSDIKAAGGSELFITATRAKTNAMEARLSDMLFPTDDKNWGIQPTPVPELTDEAKEATAKARQKVEAANAAIDQGNPEQAQALAHEAEPFAKRAMELKAELDEAKKRSGAMEAEMDDQLRECNYQAEARDVIRDACRLGTGIMKGPVVATRLRPRWKKAAAEEGSAEVYQLVPTTDPRPRFYRVDPWSFFPDMDSQRGMEDCESVFERHLMNKKELRKLSRQPGFDPDAVRRLLKADPRASTPQYISDLRSITGTFHDTGIDRYHIWEYHGPIEPEEAMDLILAAVPDEEKRQGMVEDMGDPDPLAEIHTTIWFCDGEVLKFGLHPLDSGESIYSVFNLERDEAGIFGFGVPHIVRDSQKALNGAWRMMMDNSGLSVGPQIVVNKSVVEPENGDWRLQNRKVWLRNNTALNVPAFETYEINSHQAELAGVIALARQNMDEESAVPMISQGEPASHPEPTATGATILATSINIVFRRIVKNFDDDMTTPNIRRLYDWNMQFSTKEHIKGDYEVDARGTSVLLVREIQAQNLMILLFQGSAHPIVGPLTKIPALYRKLVQSMMIPADDVVFTDDELTEMAANQPPEPNPEMEKLAMQANLAKAEHENRLQIAQMERDTTMMQIAANNNMTLEDLRTKLGMKKMEIDSKERSQAVEVAVEERNLRRGVAAPSGGNISVESNSRKADAA